MLSTHLVTHDHIRPRIVVGKVKRHLHAGVAAADDEHLLADVVVAIAVSARVEHVAVEFAHALDLRHERLGVFPGRHHQPPGPVCQP